LSRPLNDENYFRPCRRLCGGRDIRGGGGMPQRIPGWAEI
jgi:hypothetical protein